MPRPATEPTDNEALGELAQSLLPMVRAVASRAAGGGIDRDDAFQQGCVGMLKAIRAFRSDRGACLSTYAYHRIEGEIRHYIRDERRKPPAPPWAGENGPASFDPQEGVTDRLFARELILSRPERERRLILLRYACGLTQSRTAAILGVSQAQVSRRERAILKKLRKKAEY